VLTDLKLWKVSSEFFFFVLLTVMFEARYGSKQKHFFQKHLGGVIHAENGSPLEIYSTAFQNFCGFMTITFGGFTGEYSPQWKRSRGFEYDDGIGRGHLFDASIVHRVTGAVYEGGKGIWK